MKKQAYLALLLTTCFLAHAAANEMDVVDVSETVSQVQPKRVSKLAEKTSETMDKIVETAKANKLSATLKKDVQIGNLKVGIKNKIEIEPAYIGGYYVRRDIYELPINLNAGEWALDNNTRFLIPLEAGAKFTLYRLYDEYNEALSPRKKLPFLDYVLNYLPVNAEQILEKLRPGDMVKMQVPLAIRFGFAYNQELSSAFSAEAGLYKVLSGMFNVYVFRADNNKVRLRIVGLNQNNRELQLKAGFNKGHLNTLLKLLIRTTGGFDILEFDRKSGDNDIYLADYTLDFNRPEVRDAYDQLFGRAIAFKDSNINAMLLKMVNPFRSHHELRDILVSNLGDIEKLFQEDARIKNPSDRRVHRNFVGDNDAEGTTNNFEINVPVLFKGKWGLAVNESRLSNRKIQEVNDILKDVRENYIFPSWTFLKKKSSPLFSYREELLRSANLIFHADDNYTPTRFSSIGFYYDSKDSRYRESEHENSIEHFRGILPKKVFDSVIAEMQNKGVDTFNKIVKNIKVSARYFINENGLRSAEQRFSGKSLQETEKEILKLAIQHIKNAGIKSNKSASNTAIPQQCREAGVVSKLEVAAKLCRELTKISKQLAIVVSTQFTATQRKDAMEGLVDVSLFREIGPGFLFTLLPEVDFEKTARFELKFYLPEEIEPVTILRGEPLDRDLYEQILDQQAQLLNEEPDLRLDGTTDSLTERNTGTK